MLQTTLHFAASGLAWCRWRKLVLSLNPASLTTRLIHRKGAPASAAWMEDAMELRQRFHGCGHLHRQASYRTVAQLSAVGESNLGADGGKELHEMRLCPRQVSSAKTRNCTTGNRHSALVIVRQSAHSPWISRPCAWQEMSAFYHASRS